MGDDGTDTGLLLALVVPEVVLGVSLAVLLGLSLLGRGTFLATAPVWLRLGAFLFVLLEVAIPVAVYLDVRRRSDEADTVWVHAAAMPLINVFGVLAYLEDRRRSTGE